MSDVITWDVSPPLPNRTLDIAEVAAFLHVSAKTVYRLTPLLRGFKVGATWRFRPEDVLRYARGDA